VRRFLFSIARRFYQDGKNKKNDGIWRKRILDKCAKIVYNIVRRKNGGAMVSTGILRYDKRGEPGNLDNCPTEKINDNNTVAMAA